MFKINKGALHRALNVPEGRKLSAADHSRAANSSDPHVRRMEASTHGLAAMRPKSRKGSGYGGKVFK
jgi:hypothetical protein